MSVFQGSIESLDQLDSLHNQSFNHNFGLCIFKHSTSCGISKMVLRQLTKEWGNLNLEIPVYYIDLLSYRSVSNAIAERYKIVHESPQLLLIKEGKAVWSGSHYQASVDELLNQINA